jgi:hypothetical protein
MGNARYQDEEIRYIEEQLDKGVDPAVISKGCKSKFGTDRTPDVIEKITHYLNQPGMRNKKNRVANADTEMPELKPKPKEKKEVVPLTFPPITDDLLNSFIPKEMEHGYIERPEMLNQVEAIMKLPLAERKSIFLLGDTAVGKTTTPKFMAFKHKLPILLVQVDRSLNFNDLLYKIDFVNATATYTEGLFTRFLQQPCIIVLDELPSAEPEIFFKLHELLQEKRVFIKELGKVYQQHPNCYIFATGNFKNSMYVGNNKMNEALISRFMVKVMDDFTDYELDKIIELDDTKLKRQLIQFYRGVQNIIKQQNRKYVISIRNLNSIVHLYKTDNLSFSDALKWGFCDSIMVNNNSEDKVAVWDFAISIFGDRIEKELEV